MFLTCLAQFLSLCSLSSPLYCSLTSTLLSSSLFREECDPLPSEGSQKSLLTLSFPRFPMLSRPSLPSNKGWATLSATAYSMPGKQVPTPIHFQLPSPTEPQQTGSLYLKWALGCQASTDVSSKYNEFIYLVYYVCMYVLFIVVYHWTRELWSL